MSLSLKNVSKTFVGKKVVDNVSFSLEKPGVYGLKASRCGYPKEVEVVSRLQRIIGKDILDEITFARNEEEINRILQEKCGSDVAELFFEISYLMDKELKAKYDHSKFGGVFGPIKKARAYSQIDYSNIYEKLKLFKEEKKYGGDNQKKTVYC